MDRLITILLTMDVPRQMVSKLCAEGVKDGYDLRWLGRNLFTRNRSHPDFPEAVKIIRDLLGDDVLIVQ